MVTGHYAAYGVVAVDVGVPFPVFVTCQQGSMIIYNYTMDDGTPYDLSEVNTNIHTYTTVRRKISNNLYSSLQACTLGVYQVVVHLPRWSHDFLVFWKIPWQFKINIDVVLFIGFGI